MNNQEVIERFMKNEKVLWQGNPKNIPIFNKSDIWLIPFTVIFGGFLILYALISAIMMFTGQSILFSLVGITFLIMGAYILFLRLWYRKKRISRELYFVTEKRIFAFDTLRNDVIFDIPLEETEIYLGDKSLILSDLNPIGDFIYNLGLDIFFRKFSKETPCFKYIDDISGVCKIIVTAKESKEDTADDSIFI